MFPIWLTAAHYSCISLCCFFFVLFFILSFYFVSFVFSLLFFQPQRQLCSQCPGLKMSLMPPRRAFLDLMLVLIRMDIFCSLGWKSH